MEESSDGKGTVADVHTIKYPCFIMRFTGVAGLKMQGMKIENAGHKSAGRESIQDMKLADNASRREMKDLCSTLNCASDTKRTELHCRHSASEAGIAMQAHS